MHLSGIAVLYFISIFKFVRNNHIVFHSGYTTLHSHQECTRFPLPVSSPTLVISYLFDNIHLTDVRCYFIVVLICIFLIISDFEHLFMNLLATCFLIFWYTQQLFVACDILKGRVSVSRPALLDSLRPHGLQPARLFCPRDFPGKDTGVSCHFFLWGSSS